MQGAPILDFALHHLTLGRTWQLAALLECGDLSPHSLSPPRELSDQDSSQIGAEHEIPSGDESPHSKAEHHLTQSVTLLRQAGTQHHLPRSAFWRAKYQITNDKSQIELAERDLSEAETIANRGSMLIWQIEAALERSQLYLTLHHVDRSLTLRVGHDADDKPDSESQATWLEKAREKLDETKHLIKQTEKPYEPHTPDWPDWEPPEYVGVFEPGQRVGYHRRNADIEFLEAEIVGLESKDGLAWLSSDVGHGLTQMFTDRDSFRQMAQPGSVPI